MKYFLFFFLIFSFFNFTKSQNSIGKIHNYLLNNLISCKENSDFYCLNYSFLEYSFANHFTYGDDEILAFLDYSNLPIEEKKSIIDFLKISDYISEDSIEVLIDTLEKSSIQKKSSPILIGFWNVAKHSLYFWKNYRWDDDKKPPLMAVVKADALGLIKGIVLGAVFWIGSNFIFEVPDAIGIIGGSTIAVGFTALDSFRFSRKYKKRAES